ncbi:MAG: type II toxin-antitoxin system RelE/ParE family toxin [Planctomycetes bacterium]|nr:type II toxin-antitoxin system RelE/ParE family toxin [Planctomycetota bacterium]
MSRLRISRTAHADLESIWDFIGIERESPAAATRQVERIYDTFLLIVENPQIGEACDALRTGMRFFTCGSYVVFYVPSADNIEIERVAHGAQHVEDLF